MKIRLFLFLISASIFFNGEVSAAKITNIQGRQPNIAVDIKGVVRMVYGNDEKIYCITSTDNGTTFSKPVLVAQLPGMHLGNTRGPQLASSKNYSMIAAIDKAGSIHSYKLNHTKGGWMKSTVVNDKTGSAVEGLMAIGADKEDNFYATWLDIRMENKNNIYFSSTSGNKTVWNKNQLVYKSPEGHVCECCKPNITVSSNKVVIGFRNWMMGSRDIYYAVSDNKGKTFPEPKKSGTGTWRLNACPMDGGGLAVNDKGAVSAAWRRNSEVFYASPNRPEKKLGTGRDVSMAVNKGNTLVAWHENNTIRIMDVNKNTTMQAGKGVTPKIYFVNNGKAICVWEEDKMVRYKVI